MPFELLPLIQEVHRQARLQGLAPPAATRLVKILYLADLEWRRRHVGEPLAKLTWRFLHFGPYACELAPFLGGEDVERKEFLGGKVAKRLVFPPEELGNVQVPEDVCRLLAGLVKAWGDADLNILLDYVYFETEPMENAQRGELLDFSRLREPAPQFRFRVDPQKLKALRARLRERVEQLHLCRDGVQEPWNAHEGSRAWDEDDRSFRIPVDTPIDLPGA
jgi:hypothetical protein